MSSWPGSTRIINELLLPDTENLVAQVNSLGGFQETASSLSNSWPVSHMPRLFGPWEPLSLTCLAYIEGQGDGGDPVLMQRSMIVKPLLCGFGILSSGAGDYRAKSRSGWISPCSRKSQAVRAHLKRTF